MHRVVSRRTSAIAITATPVGGFENLHTLNPNPEALVIITNPLRMHVKEMNQGQRMWQLQPQAVSTHQPMVSGSRSIY
jgi:hypothetical protein